MKAIFTMMAGYNRWANTRLYKMAGVLTREQYRLNRGAFFGSLNGTMNHILVADRVWMRRFTGTGQQPGALDAILFDELADLTRARAEEDARIIAYVDELNEETLATSLSYRTLTDGKEITQPLGSALMHFFNHQTHHRGQAHCLLTELTGDAPSFDLTLYQRDSGAGMG